MRGFAERRSRRSTALLAALAWAAGLGTIAVAAALVGLILVRGLGTLGPGLLFGDVPAISAILGRAPVFDGIWPAVAGTLALVLGTSLLAIPLGIASGIYLAEYGRGRWSRAFGFAVDMLAAVPSILVGLFGFGLILLLRRTIAPDANTCLLLAIVCLALLVLPYPIRATEAALRGLPESIRLIGPSLGLSPGQSLRHVLLPAARRGILGGVILSVGRAAEDLAVILLTGAVASGGVPGSITDRFEAIPFHIYYLASEHRSEAELDRAFGAALILMALTAVLFATAYHLHGRIGRGRA